MKNPKTQPPIPLPWAAPQIKKLQHALLTWYRQHHRRLPWRATPGSTANPYHVLVSEAMLQQTQVATVISYFNRFIELFPTLTALAQAPEQQVLSAWQGLGYYRRARNLHRTANLIVQNHRRQIPQNIQDLLQLPGIGRYTAGAIASIAFQQPQPLLDGNVMRVFSRWTALQSNIDHPPTQQKLWTLASALLPQQHPGDFNQALMELGAIICLPANPQCSHCPIQPWCRAHHLGIAQELPVRTQRKKPKKVRHHILMIQRGKLFLFEKRPDQGLWSAMWQMPTLEEPKQPVTSRSLQQWCQTRYALILTTAPKKVAAFQHATTHRTILFTLWKTHSDAASPPKHSKSTPTHKTPRLWRSPTQINDLPMPNPQHQALAFLTQKQSSTPQPS